MLCYIADLGLSIELDEADDDSEIGIAGSRFWLAPEMIRGDGYGVKVRSYNLYKCYRIYSYEHHL
jgi:serine/threonine protein kinase